MVNRPNAPLPPASDFVSTKLKARFWMKVSPAPADACWIWHGATNTRGYGNFGIDIGPDDTVKHRTYLAHRVAYEITYGAVPPGKDLDHLCKTKGCVNPDHLEPVTFLANMRRRYSDNPDERETHCLRGHELTTGNTQRVATTGQRRCLTCYPSHRREVS